MDNSPKAPLPERKLMNAAYLFVKSLVVFGSAAVTLYFLIGCLMYGDWWFRFVWDRQFADADYIADAFSFLLNDRFYLLLGIVFAIFIGTSLTWVYRKPVFTFVDKFGPLVFLSSFAIVIVTALLLYHTKKDSYPFMLQADADANLQQTLEVMESTKRGIQNSIGPPTLLPPVDFHYLDKDRIDALFSQIQSTLVEKERTVSTSGNVRGKVGAATGLISAEVESGKSASSTSSFSRTDFSSERKCIEVVNYLIENNTPQYYRNREEWLLRRANADYWIAMQKFQLNPTDPSAIHGIRPLTDKASKEEKAEAERKAKQFEQFLMDYLKTSGFVVVDGAFSLSANGNNIILLEHFAAKPTVVFRVTLPKSALSDVPHEGSLQMRVFGDVIKPLDSGGYVDVRPIALY
jgi:hypothetical protein